MTQSRRVSLLESLTNVAVGLLLALLTQAAVFPLFGLRLAPFDHLRLALLFTASSILRGYALRRLFDRLSGPRDRR